MFSSSSCRYNFNTILVMYFLLSLLFCKFDFSLAGRTIPPSGPSTLVRPLMTEDNQEGVSMKLKPHHQLRNNKQQVFHAREIKDCMPKGYKKGSAPSRFVNYHALDADCSSSTAIHSKKT